MKQSKFLTLNIRDLVKGLIMAVFGAIAGAITAAIETGHLFDWQYIWKAALLAAAAYITKNLFTNSKDDFLTTEK